MTYEGDISNHRGHVQRVAAGTAKVIAQSIQNLQVELMGSLQTALNLPL
jgi:hypothetical protein